MAITNVNAWLRKGALLAVTIAWVLSASPAQGVIFATHDWNGVSTQDRDTWADVKTPGDGRTYCVGTTIALSPASGGSPFSTQAAAPPPVPPGSFSTATKQVAIVQIAEPGQPAGILRQAYFYGFGSMISGAIGTSTFARAISVWPAATLSDTRIAICGGTRDPQIPLSPTPMNQSGVLTIGGFPPDTGFIAVYNGDLQLQWAYHFFADDQNAKTVITDVSIRVEQDASGQPREYVTYCGATRNGNPVAGPVSTMLPLAQFAAPPAFQGDTYAGGNADNGAFLQWDGIVGRVSSVQGAASPALDFHSIVGGAADDALLGIAQKSLGEFVVVGTTQGGGAGLAFPLTAQDTFAGGTIAFSTLPSWSLGVVLRFTSSTPANPLINLQLNDARVIGTASSTSVARDVLWQKGVPGGLDWIYVVGSTDFSQLASEPGYAGQATGAFVGSSSGYLLATPSVLLGSSVGAAGWWAGRYLTPPQGALSSGAIGVAAWNEYHDHVAVCGWTEYIGGTRRMLVTSCFREPGTGGSNWLGLSALRQLEADGPPGGNLRSDCPGASETGLFQAFSSTPAFVLSAPGPMTSGGVSVDPQGRVTMVGNTTLPQTTGGSQFPIVGPAAETRASQGILTNTVQIDALRVIVDMLPYGVCRNDTVTGCLPLAGTAGGTTPACAISQFGNAVVTPALERMFIDVDGIPAPNASISILVDRPVSGAAALGALWLGLPVPTPSPLPGIEVWGNISTAVTFATIPVDESWRLPLSPLPAGSATFTIQFVSLFLPGDYCLTSGCTSNPSCQSGAVFSSAASPALFFTY